MKNINYPKVEKRPLYTLDRGNGPSFRVPVDGLVALVNPETNHTYGVHSDRYNLTRHEEMLEPIMNLLVREGIRFDAKVAFPEDGARLWAKLILLDLEYPVRVNDYVNPTLEVFGSYDGHWPRKMQYGAWRQICTNGLVVSVTFDIFYQRHWLDFDPAEAIEMVRNANDVFTAQTDTWRRWSETPALPDDYERMLEPLRLSGKDINEIGRLVEVSSHLTIDALKLRTLDRWTMFNIVTQYLTHNVKGGAARQAELFARLRNAL